MGKLATAGGRVTRDNEEQEASAWSVERSGASSSRAFVAISTVGIVAGSRLVCPVDAVDAVDAVEPDNYIEWTNNVSSNEDHRRARVDLESKKLKNDRLDNCNANAINLLDANRPSRGGWFSEHYEHCECCENFVNHGNHVNGETKCFVERIEGDSRVHIISFEKRKRRSRLLLETRISTNLLSSIKRRTTLDRRVRYCHQNRRRHQFHRNDGLFVLLGLAAIGAALCVPASSVPMPSRVDTLVRTGPRYNLDRSTTGLEDVYEDAFENAFQEEDRPTTRTVLNDTELDIIRRSIVRGLGLKRIPDPSKANISQAEYERAHREYLKKVQPPFDEQSFNGNKRLHVFHATAYPGNESSHIYKRCDKEECHRHRLFFPVEIPEENDVTSVDHATLRFLLHGLYSDDRDKLSGADEDALLYLRTFRSRKLLVRKRINLKDWRNSKWLEFDLTVAVSSWLDDAPNNFALELEFRRNGAPVKRTFSSPVLNVFTVTGDVHARTKRSTPEQLMSLHKGRRTKCKGESKKCCRHELTVMFKDLKGFEFIVYPKTFDAGYCKGRCPPRYNPAHHHALLQSLLWKEDRKKVPKPCCAPSKLDQLMIVYFDENDSTQLKVSYWQNIQVLECACS